MKFRFWGAIAKDGSHVRDVRKASSLEDAEFMLFDGWTDGLKALYEAKPVSISVDTGDETICSPQSEEAKSISQVRQAIASIHGGAIQRGQTSARMTRAFMVLDELLGMLDDAASTAEKVSAPQLSDQLARAAFVDHIISVLEDLFRSVHEVAPTQAARWVMDFLDSLHIDLEHDWNRLSEDEDQAMLTLVALQLCVVNVFGEHDARLPGFSPLYRGIPIRSEEGYPTWEVLKTICQDLPATIQASFEVE
ncbi:hypothetical protein ABIC83_003044 [Roseateles asaccharophilus]|uniref:hypothetical protein n=1 Tax=Roseateles asaccharophilus TaxID=582607 RepID=UPI003834C695